MKLAAGELITERLRLVRPIGKGGMGSVWVAYHETLKTEVAVKFIEDEAKTSAKALARFEREAEIAAKLKNPHVAQMFDHGRLADGTTTSSRWSPRGPSGPSSRAKGSWWSGPSGTRISRSIDPSSPARASANRRV